MRASRRCAPRWAVPEVATAPVWIGTTATRRSGSCRVVRGLYPDAPGPAGVVEGAAGEVAARDELVEVNADFPLGTTDAAVVAVAERLRITQIATLECRLFHAFGHGTRAASSRCPDRRWEMTE